MIKPYLRGQDVARWETPQHSRFVIQIESSENRKHPWSGLDAEEAERVFKATHRRIYDFMMRYRSELIDRYDQGRYFWELRACRYWDDFLTPKILSTKVSIEPTFCLDETGSILGNTSYFFAVTKTPHYIVGLLNSSVSAFFSKNIFVAKQGGFYEVQPDSLEQFPIPEATADQANQVTTLVRFISKQKNQPEFERLLNGLVYELFFPDDLHAKNIRLFDACAAAGVGEGMDAAAIAAKIFHPSHMIYGMLFDLQSVEAVRIIEGLD